MMRHVLTHAVVAAEEDDETPVDEFILRLNSVIKLYKLEISKVRDEKDGATNYVLVNLADNQVSRQSSLRPQQQLHFFNRILTAILSSDDKSLAVIEALNMVLDMDSSGSSRQPKMGIGQAEGLTDLWVRDHLLERCDDGDSLILGFVALAEFSHFIKAQYAESYKQCPGCQLICLRGVTCQTCASKTHVHCTATVPDNFPSFKCLTCRTD